MLQLSEHRPNIIMILVQYLPKGLFVRPRLTQFVLNKPPKKRTSVMKSKLFVSVSSVVVATILLKWNWNFCNSIPRTEFRLAYQSNQFFGVKKKPFATVRGFFLAKLLVDLCFF